MDSFSVSRRSVLLESAGAALAAAGVGGMEAQVAGGRGAPVPAPTPDQIRRLAWWKEAKYGLFIHYGLYSVWGRQEWAVEKEAIPIVEYQEQAKHFAPKPDAAREWARLAKASGMRYMVFTAKHHEGFCNFASKLTDYNSMAQGPKRDLVKEYVEAARAEGLGVGIYYSLMDWHHPDGERSRVDEAARKRFIDYTFGLITELMSNYGKIDILWYDGGQTLNARQQEADRMNEMVLKLQPDIIFNNRNHAEGDFSTPEQRILAAGNGRAWESCMTLNESWGYDAEDDDWKSPRTVMKNLIQCARDGGNYLLNVGPRGDGTMPEPAVKILTEVGQWLAGNGDSIFKATAPCQPWRPSYATFSRQGNTLYMHVHYWPGNDVSLSGLLVKVKSAYFLRTKQPLKFTQDDVRVHITGLPVKAPDSPVTTIAIECDGLPMMNQDPELRLQKPRAGVGMEA